MSEIQLSPFYHSAVNAVTKPGKYTATSNYFVDRWMPLLGGNGTMIVMALRREGFLDRRKGECRDEIVMDGAELATAAGMSEDTLTRELGIDKKTGKPKNPWISLFVQKQQRQRRNKAGQVRQMENAYWIAMDDPVHPDDWPLVAEAVWEAEARVEKQHGRPGPHFADSGRSPNPQNAGATPQNAARGPQNAGRQPQNAGRLKSPDSFSPKMTPPDISEGSASLFEEKEPEQEEAARAVLSLLDQAKLAEVAWKQLPEVDRAPWLLQAERELIAIHAGTGLAVKPRLIEARGANLYEMSLRDKEPKS